MMHNDGVFRVAARFEIRSTRSPTPATRIVVRKGVGLLVTSSLTNPLTATLYPKEKTHYLSILHAGWPAGLILGGLLSWLMAERNGQVIVRWEIQWLLVLIPVLIYGWLMFRQKFPLSEARAAGVTFATMLKEFAQPVLLALLLLHVPAGHVVASVQVPHSLWQRLQPGGSQAVVQDCGGGGTHVGETILQV